MHNLEIKAEWLQRYSRISSQNKCLYCSDEISIQFEIPRGLPPGETRGIHVNSASFLFKTRGDLAEFTWFARWAAGGKPKTKMCGEESSKKQVQVYFECWSGHDCLEQHYDWLPGWEGSGTNNRNRDTSLEFGCYLEQWLFLWILERWILLDKIYN